MSVPAVSNQRIYRPRTRTVRKSADADKPKKITGRQRRLTLKKLGLKKPDLLTLPALSRTLIKIKKKFIPDLADLLISIPKQLLSIFKKANKGFLKSEYPKLSETKAIAQFNKDVAKPEFKPVLEGILSSIKEDFTKISDEENLSKQDLEALHMA